MDCDFSQLGEDQVNRLRYMIYSLNEAFLKEYLSSLNIINVKSAIDNKDNISVQLSDLLTGSADEAVSYYQDCMSKIQSLMADNLK